MTEDVGRSEAVAPGIGSARLPYLPAIDGLRTIALAAVLLDHGGVTAVVGGHFGVTVFFVLSGFLVTALLVQEFSEFGRIDLRAFWARRARRLVPGSLAFTAFVVVYLALGATSAPTTVVGDGLASLAWMANWRFVLTSRSYGNLFADPTPFAHVWSLAVEEQFYLALPVAAAVVLRGRGTAFRLGTVLLLTATASAAWMWLSFDPGGDPLRVYYGTDTRVAELAIGGVLGVLLLRRGQLVAFSHRVVRVLSVLGPVALFGIGAAVATLSTADAATYRGGLLGVALLSAIVVTACTQDSSFLARVLATEPLPQLGRLTYGAYLFHWPVFLWLDQGTMGLQGLQLLAMRLVLTFVLAYASLALVERPVKRWQLPRPILGLAWLNGSLAVAALLVLAVLASVTSSSQLAAGDVLAPPPVPVTAPPPAEANGALASRPGSTGAASHGGGLVGAEDAAAAPYEGRKGPAGEPASHRSAQAPPTTTAPATTSTTAVVDDADALRVAVVGDSLAHNLGAALTRLANQRSDLIVYDVSISSCPISRGGTRRFGNGRDFPIAEQCGWWDDPADERSRNLTTFDAHVVLVEDALNEIVDRKVPGWPDYRAVGDPRFDAWLLNEYRAAAEVFSSDGAIVVYANAPCADWGRLPDWRSIQDAERRVESLNRIYENVVGATTKVADLYERVCPGGDYRDVVEGVENGRPDGFHLSDEASDLLAERWLAPFLQDVDRVRPPEL